MTGERAEKMAYCGQKVRRRKWHPDSHVSLFKGFLVRHRSRGFTIRERAFFDFTPDMKAARDWEVYV